MQANPSTSHRPPATNCVLNQVICRNTAANKLDMLQIS